MITVYTWVCTQCHRGWTTVWPGQARCDWCGRARAPFAASISGSR